MSPDDAWPFPHGNLSEDELADVRLIRVADTFAGESQRIRRLQTLVLLFGAVVVGVLLLYLGYSICKGFDGHLTAAEQMLAKAVAQSTSGASPPASAAASSASTGIASSAAASQANTGKGKSVHKAEVNSTAPPAPTASKPDASLHELLSTSVKAIASTTVAVIWVLVIAIAVITIAIARAVLSLKPQRLDSSADGEKNARADNSAAIALPGLEFAKEIVKLIADTAKSVGK